MTPDDTATMLSVWREYASKAGSCNFCSRQVTTHGTIRTAVVTIVKAGHQSGGANMTVRFCSVCLKQLIKQAKP
jgi:hypothetical protein